jgi:2-haloacid dehalogenase
MAFAEGIGACLMSQRDVACVFDAYGTLFNVHSAVARHANSLGKAAAEISNLWRTKQLEYSWVHSLMRRHVDFWELTQRALDYALAVHRVSDDRLRRALMQSYLALDAYDEIPSVLRRLREAGIKTAILSNGSPFMLQHAMESAGIGDLIDKCLSIEEVRVYKPDPAAYQIATSALKLQSPGEARFFSSNAWDVAGAHTFGFRALWVNRSRQPEEYELHEKVQRSGSLSDAIELVVS